MQENKVIDLIYCKYADIYIEITEKSLQDGLRRFLNWFCFNSPCFYLRRELPDDVRCKIEKYLYVLSRR